MPAGKSVLSYISDVFVFYYLEFILIIIYDSCSVLNDKKNVRFDLFI